MTEKKSAFQKGSANLTESNVKKLEQMLIKQKYALEKFEKETGTDETLSSIIDSVNEWIRIIGGDPLVVTKDTEKVLKTLCNAASTYADYLKYAFGAEEKRRVSNRPKVAMQGR